MSLSGFKEPRTKEKGMSGKMSMSVGQMATGRRNFYFSFRNHYIELKQQTWINPPLKVVPDNVHD